MSDRAGPVEPGSPGFWALIVTLVLLCVPYAGVWFFDLDDRVWGIPYWFFISLAAAIGISAASIRRILRHWEIENRLP